jgi:hypothetical protein
MLGTLSQVVSAIGWRKWSQQQLQASSPTAATEAANGDAIPVMLSMR